MNADPATAGLIDKAGIGTPIDRDLADSAEETKGTDEPRLSLPDSLIR